ncbi:MAG: hypothetical protein ACI8V5_000911, partial [Limisphaerales bacterium]
PDVEIWLHPDDYISGEDPQIDKAIEMLTSDEAAAAAGN